MSVIDKEYEAKMGLGPHTEKQGKKMLGVAGNNKAKNAP